MKNNCKSAIFIVIITIILSGCSCFNSGQDDVGVSDIQEITVDNKNELYTYPNVYINGSFGEETYYYDWRQDSSAKKYKGKESHLYTREISTLN